MNQAPARARTANILLGIVFVLLSSVTGAIAGGAWVRFLAARVSSGWDGLAAALGALAVGGLVGFALSAFAVRGLARRGPRSLAKAIAAVSLVGSLLFAAVWLARP